MAVRLSEACREGREEKGEKEGEREGEKEGEREGEKMVIGLVTVKILVENKNVR
jgi:predicted transposase YdaD